MAFNHLLRERDRREIDPFLAVFALLDSSSLSTPSALSREASDLVAQKNKDINSLSDELAIHRLELSQKDELITKLNQRVSNLSSENSSLLDNIKKIKEAQVHAYPACTLTSFLIGFKAKRRQRVYRILPEISLKQRYWNGAGAFIIRVCIQISNRLVPNPTPVATSRRVW